MNNIVLLASNFNYYEFDTGIDSNDNIYLAYNVNIYNGTGLNNESYVQHDVYADDADAGALNLKASGQTPTTIQDYSSKYSPKITIDGEDNIHLTHSFYDAHWEADWKVGIYYSKLQLQSDNSFQTIISETLIATAEHMSTFSMGCPAPATNSLGTNIVTYGRKQPSSLNEEIYLKRINPDGTTQDEIQLTDEDGLSALPLIAINSSGITAIAYTDNKVNGYDGPFNVYLKLNNPIDPPQNFNAEGGDKQITFTWSHPIQEAVEIPIANYRVIVKEGASIVANLRIDPSLTEYTVAGLNNTTEYSCYMRTIYAHPAGEQESEDTSIVWIRPMPEVETPLNFRISDVDVPTDTVSLTWDRPTDPDNIIGGYEVFVGTSPDVFDTVYEALGAGNTSTQINVVNLATNTYYFKIRSFTMIAPRLYSVSSEVISTDDTRPPTQPILSYPEDSNWVISPVTFSWLASTDDYDATDSGLAGYNIYINSIKANASLLTDTTFTTTLTDGSYTWKVEAVDFASNSSTSETRTVNIDSTPPGSFDLITPTPGAIFSYVNIDFVWDASIDAGSGIAGYTLYIMDGGTTIATIETASANAVYTFEYDGEFSWYVMAHDVAGSSTMSNQTRGSRMMTINSGGPDLTIYIDEEEVINPLIDFATGTTPLIRAEAIDGNGVKTIALVIDGIPAAGESVSGTAGDTVRELTCQITFPLTNGIHPIIITSEDMDGQTSDIPLNLLVTNSGAQVIAGSLKNDPNPFDPKTGTTIGYSLTADAKVKLLIYNLAGKLVKTFLFPAGSEGGKINSNDVVWDGKDNFGSTVANGPHLYFIFADEELIGRGEMAAYR
jgi:hypothetical protein